MMGLYAVVDGESREVSNVVIWDGESGFSAPAGSELVEVADGDAIYIGGTIDAQGVHTPPEGLSESIVEE